MLGIQKILDIFKVDENEVELNRERFSALVKQIPLMYGILLVNMITLVYPHVGSAPDYLTIYIPAVLSIIFIMRAVGYLRTTLTEVSDQEIVKKLSGTIRLSVVLSFVFILWSFELFYYSNDLMLVHIIFFLYITLFACVFCLLHIIQSAIYLTFIIIVPSFLYLMAQEHIVFKAMAINSLLVSTGIIFLLTNHYKNFTGLVRQKSMLVEQRKKLNQFNVENIRLANMDMLTSLPNRRNFFAQLNALTKSYEGHPNKRLVVGLLDLDGFKRINDIFGHPTGDDLLIKTSERLASVLGEDITLARLGGDEFGIIITKDKDLKNVMAIGEQLCEAMRADFRLRDGTMQIAATVGFVEFPTMADNPQQLFERADYALCYSKQHSKGKPVIFSTEHETIIREVAIIEQQLHEADLDKELSIVFQPIVDIQNQKVMGFEALARWNNPTLGNVRPDLFIRSAEQMGTISKFTVILLRKALKLACEWPTDLYMSFNLSTYDLASPETILNLVSIIEKSDFPSKNIVFEVTETAVMHDMERAIEALRLLKLQGAQVALDDFGTGYSSLSYVQRMPLDRLKIDRSFINEIDTDNDTKNIVRSIIDLCNNLNLYCIIEGVETESQLNVLAEIGGRYVQGYYFSRPMPPADAMKFLTSSLNENPKKALPEKWSAL
ncbi:MAG: EAL domain-containing protein [Alphaproteobacteria bacterium]|nr:EAL domain-containing protein [Alphaproteobacteria bacterium]